MKEITKRDAIEAVDILNGCFNPKNTKNYSTYSKIILFSNENLEGTAASLSYKNKSVLTVASSGDQFLAATYYGAKKVDLFDINRFTYYLTCLKIAAVKHLNYYQFLNFFIPPYMFEKNDYFFAVSTLKELIPFMSDDVAYFWKEIVNCCGDKKNVDIGRLVDLYDLTCDEISIRNGSPYYENKEGYLKLQDRIRDVETPNFIETDLLDISSVLKDSYDIMYISNIIYRLAISNDDANELMYYKKVLNQLKGKLNDNGKVMANYYCNAKLEDVGFEDSSLEKISFRSKYLPYDDEFFDVDSDVAMIYTHKK